jgi:hypothetical protein
MTLLLFSTSIHKKKKKKKKKGEVCASLIRKPVAREVNVTSQTEMDFFLLSSSSS